VKRENRCPQRWTCCTATMCTTSPTYNCVE